MTEAALIALLRSWQDFFPLPPTWTGELQRRATEGRGPASFGWLECPDCHGEGKHGRWACQRCGGAGGFYGDPYTQEPVAAGDSASWQDVLEQWVNCSTCGGWGRLSAYADARPDPHTARLCDECEGTGKVPALFAKRLDDAGQTRQGDRTLDALTDQSEKRDRLRCYVELAAAMDALKAVMPGTHFLVCWIYVIEAQTPSPANEDALAAGVSFMLARLQHIRDPGLVTRQLAAREAALARAKGKSADSRARAARDALIRQRRAAGAKLAELAAEFHLDKGQVSRITRSA